MAIYNGAYSGPDIDRLLAKADSSDIFSEERLNGLSFEKISKTDYESLEEKDPEVIYYVYDEKNRIKQYIGSSELAVARITSGNMISHLQNRMYMFGGTIIEEE